MSRGKEERKRMPHFCKFFLPGVTDQTLRIPQPFLKYIKLGAYGRASLMSPNGKLWHLDLVENVNDFFFQDGWTEFVRDCDLQVGDFLVFRYDGDLHFTVQTFCTTGCAKDEFFCSEPCEESSSVEEADGSMKVQEDDAEDFNSSPYEVVSSGMSGKHNKIIKQEPESEEIMESNKVKQFCNSQSKGLLRHTGRLGQQPVYEEQNSSKRYVTRSSHRLAGQLSLSKKPGSSTERGKKNLPQQSSYKRSASATRNLRGQSRTRPARNNQLAARGHSFKQLASSAKGAKSPSHVVISEILSQCQKQAVERSLVATRSNMKPSSSEVLQSKGKKPTVPRQRSKKKGSHQVQSNCLTLTVATSRHQKKGYKLRIGGFMSQRRSVTQVEIAKALEKAKLFKSKNPSVAIAMRGGYVYTGFQMSFPRSFVVSYLPKKNGEVTLWDPNGRGWAVKYITRGPYGSLNAGWAAFSFANNIEEDDVCIFEVIERNEMRVHIFRVVEDITPLVKISSKLQLQR